MELVERLREMAGAHGHHHEDRARWAEAADTIESLRTQLATLQRRHDALREAASDFLDYYERGYGGSDYEAKLANRLRTTLAPGQGEQSASKPKGGEE